MGRSASSRNASERHAAPLVAAAFGLAVLVRAAPAAAEEDAQQCVAHNDRGNELRVRGKLLAAKAEFLRCATASCPKIIREECAALVARVEASTPTLVVAAIDADGKDLTGVEIFVDGVRVSAARPGQALAVDPGSHRLRVVAGDGEAGELEIVAREGEKNRTVRVDLPHRQPALRAAPAPAPAAAAPVDVPPAPARVKPPALAWVLGGIGVAALGSFAYFALAGESRTSCAPSCSDDEIDDIYQNYLFADVSLGVGAAALGVATYLFLTAPAPSERAAIGIQPAPRGATIGTRIAF